MLAVFRTRYRPSFTDSDVTMTTMFAGQMALALELAEHRAHRERLALLDERDRIARDLHDHVIQRLFAIGLAVQSTSAIVDGVAAKRLLASVDDIDDTIGQIRATIYRLTGPILSSYASVRSQADRLIDELEPVLGFRADLDVRGPVDFGVDEEIVEDFVAVVREALSNVARHAHATNASVGVTVTPTVMTVQVCDNGRGMGSIDRRSGLANLRARAERRGGTLTVASSSAGTTLVWSIPVDGPVGAFGVTQDR
jgi:signal transduction histidine kinase